MWAKRLLAAAVLVTGFGGQASATNITPYYLFDGDSSVAFEIVNGVVVNQFATFSLGYPPAIRDTIQLGHRDDNGSVEFNLDGTPTGNTGAGGTNFSQLLDGATGNGVNYGVECCGETDSVTIADEDWSNQAVLFDLSDGGQGIAFDPTNDTLYVSLFSGDIVHFDLAGAILDTLTIGQSLVGLAYDGLTDSFWGYNTGSDNLVQFDRAGNVLDDVNVTIDGNDFFASNPFGGEMAVSDRAPPEAPEPATLGLLGLGMLGLGLMRARRSA